MTISKLLDYHISGHVSTATLTAKLANSITEDRKEVKEEFEGEGVIQQKELNSVVKVTYDIRLFAYMKTWITLLIFYKTCQSTNRSSTRILDLEFRIKNAPTLINFPEEISLKRSQ